MGRHNKRPKNYYIQSAKRQKGRTNVLGPGVQGFLCTCNFHERDCVREAYNLLNQFADQLHGPEQLTAMSTRDDKDTEQDVAQQGGEKCSGEEATAEAKTEAIKRKEKADGFDEGGGSDDDDELDIDAALKADIEELQNKSSGWHKGSHERPARRFQQVESGASNCIFIKTTLPDPLPLSLTIMDHILQTQEQCTKRLVRLVPVQATCKAFQEDIEKAAKQLADKFFETGGKSFYIAFKSRNNSSVKRESVTGALVKVLQEAHSENTPDMVTPDVVLSVEVIKSVCCLSLLPGYLTKYAKYNLVTLANKGKEEQQKGDKSQNGAAKDKLCKDDEEKVKVMDQDEAGVEERKSQDEAGVEERKSQDEAVKQENKAMKREDMVVTSQDEAVKSQDEAVKSQDEAVKSQDEAVKSQDEAVKSQDEAVKTQDEAVKSQDEAVKSQDEAVKGQDEAVKTQDEAVKSQDEAVKSQDEAVKGQDEAVKIQDEAVKSQDEAVKSQDEAVKRQKEEVTDQKETEKESKASN